MQKLNRSIDRGLAVLEVVHTSGTISLAGLAERTGLPKPTLFRICATLVERRWLLRRGSNGSYQIGSAFPQRDGMQHHIDHLVAVSKDAILKLSDETGLGVDLAAGIGGGRIEIVDTTRRFKAHGVYPDSVGFRPSPILSALGSAFLFALSDINRAKVMTEFADHLPREDVNAMLGIDKVLKRIAEQGYAVRTKDHWGRAVDYGELPGAIAVPIVAGNEPVGAINLVWNANKHSVAAVAKNHLAQLRSVASTIGQAYAARK